MAGCRLCSGRVKQFRLVGKVYKLCRVRNPFKWLCPRYRIGYGVAITRKVWSMVIRVLCIWLLRLFEYILIIIIVVISFIIIIFHWSWHYLSFYHLPVWRGGTCWVHLYSPICYCIFSSRSRLRAWGVRVEDVCTRVDPVEVSYLSRVVL
jgi:hypothetical protein